MPWGRGKRVLVRRVLATFVVLTLLLMGSAATVGAAPAGQARIPRASGQEVGDAVTLFSTDGDEEGTFTVTDMNDDFEDTEERAPSGERMVSLDVAIEADGGDIAVDPESFNIVDGTGVLWIDIDVTRTDDKESLEAGDLADGESVEGSVEIVIPTGVDVSKVIYIVDNERVLTLVDNTDGVEAGDVVDVFTVEGDEAGTIVADEVFEDGDIDVAAGSEPGRGAAYYGVAVTVEATGTDPIDVGPELFIAVDVNGTVWASTDTIERTRAATRDVPDLESGQATDGEPATGFVGFSVDEAFPIDYVAFVPDARFYPVVDAAPSTGGRDDATPVADDDDSGLGRTDEDTPVADDTAGDCAGVADWEDAAVANVQEWGDVFSSLDADNLDADDLRASAADVQDVADAQADSTPPATAEALNDLLVTSYEDSADALNDLADAVEQGDDDLRLEAANTITDIGQSFQDGEVSDAVEALRAACPDEVDEL